MECSVCLEPYDSNNFSILPCRHSLCFECYLTLHSRADMYIRCPICRCEIHCIHLRVNPRPGKLKLKQFSNIKKHVIYKYNLPLRRASHITRFKFKLLKIALVGLWFLWLYRSVLFLIRFPNFYIVFQFNSSVYLNETKAYVCVIAFAFEARF